MRAVGWVVAPLAGLACLVTISLAAPSQAELVAPSHPVTIIEVIDGDTVILSDQRTVRLVGIQAPKLPLGRPGLVAWPLADVAKAALGVLALGQAVTLSYGGSKSDRYGRVLAHLALADGRWLQGEMLAHGLARVYSFADNRARIAEMLALETAAREAGRGIWADPFYRIVTAETAVRHIGDFQLVEGRVHRVATVRGRTYINFEEDWRRDFTIMIPPRASRLFASAGIEPRDYEGRRVRARGWLKFYNGPEIEATHPEQIEVLEE